MITTVTQQAIASAAHGQSSVPTALRDAPKCRARVPPG